MNPVGPFSLQVAVVRYFITEEGKEIRTLREGDSNSFFKQDTLGV